MVFHPDQLDSDSKLMSKLDPQWLEQLHASVNQPPLLRRDPLVLGENVIGSVVSDAFKVIIETQDFFASDELRLIQTTSRPIWKITGNATNVLQRIAHVMREARYARVAEQWRDEPLAVLDATGQQIAVVERGAVRSLGIASRCVHLIGYTPDQKVWIQQRAWNKENDPGLWDTLMGGMVSAADTVDVALARETLEEAGVGLEQLSNLRWAGHFTLRMPESDDRGLGYVVEHVDWFQCILPHEVLPLNSDGEVQQFRLVSKMELRSMLHDNQFTSEAALIFSMSDGIF